MYRNVWFVESFFVFVFSLCMELVGEATCLLYMTYTQNHTHSKPYTDKPLTTHTPWKNRSHTHTSYNPPSRPPQHTQTVLEGDLVNINVTGPAATIALALLYLKSNDAHVANLFAIPTTRHDLNYVRPDLLQLRVLARCLVMWDEVQATEGWLIGQFPTLVKVGGGFP